MLLCHMIGKRSLDICRARKLKISNKAFGNANKLLLAKDEIDNISAIDQTRESSCADTTESAPTGKKASAK